MSIYLIIGIWLGITTGAYFVHKKMHLPWSLCAFLLSAGLGPSLMLGVTETGMGGFVSEFGTISRRIEIRLEDIIIAYWFIGWFLNGSIRHSVRIKKRTLFNFLALFILLCIFGTIVFFARSERFSLVPIFYSLKYFEYFLIFLYVSNKVKNENQVVSLVKLILYTGLLIGLWAIYQVTTGTYFTMDYSARAVLPFHDGPGPLAGYILLLIPLALFGGFRGRLVSKPMAIILLIVLIMALYGAGSKLAIIGGIISLGAFCILYYQRALLILMAVILFITVILIISPQLVERSLLGRFTDIESSFKGPEASVTKRLHIWTIGLQEFLKYPLVGIGISGFPVADNYFIKIMVEFGAIGMIILLLFLFQFYKIGKQLIYVGRFLDISLYKMLGVAYLCTLASMIIYAFSIDVFQPIRVMNTFWFYSGLIFVASEKLSRSTFRVKDSLLFNSKTKLLKYV